MPAPPISTTETRVVTELLKTLLEIERQQQRWAAAAPALPMTSVIDNRELTGFARTMS